MVERKIPAGQGDSALSRWSRRKQQSRAEHEQQTPSTEESLATRQNEADATAQLPDQPPETPSANPAEPNSADEPAVDEQEEPLLTDADMPPLESLDSTSDLSCFFNSGVSEKLRQAALRRLLRLPAFNITDGLNDYDEDYTVFEPLGDIVTSDMRFHAERKAKLAEQEEAAKLAQQDADAGEVSAEDAAPDDEADTLAESESATGPETGDDPQSTEDDTQVAQGRVDDAGDNDTEGAEATDVNPEDTPCDESAEKEVAASDASSNQSNRNKLL